MRDGLGITTTYTIDPVGNQIGITPSQGPITTNEYDENSQLVHTFIGSPTYHDTFLYYDAAGRQTTKVETADIGYKTTVTRYNGLGQVTSITDPDNRMTTYSYDIRGNKLSAIETSFAVFNAYDRGDREAKMVDSTGRIKKQDYNDADNPSDLSDVIGTVTRDYDANQQLTQLRAPNEATTTFSYDSNGSLESHKQANGISTGFTYDDAGKLKAIDTTKTNGSSILNIDYDYLDEMNIGTETVAGAARTYKYDDSKQLTQWKKGGNTVIYDYDDAGNITAAGADIYLYDSKNQMTTRYTGSTTTTFEYDTAGNLTKAISGADTTNYVWDGNNRLKEIGGADTTLTFSYDSENKRLTKTEATATTGFVYDGINLIAEKDASGTITAKYYRNDSGQLVSMKKNGNDYYFHLNHRGDVVKITNASETIVAEYQYDPWGNILETSGTFANEQPFRYASYYWDSEIGMYYLINRHYDPELRRFISKDPAVSPEDADSKPAETNPYAYASNNPIVGIDPEGLYSDGNPNYHRLLSYGSQGEDVRALQRALRRADMHFKAIIDHYGGADGIFGRATASVVRSYQTAFGLMVDGIVGRQTWGRLASQGYIQGISSAPAHRDSGSQESASFHSQPALVRMISNDSGWGWSRPLAHTSMKIAATWYEYRDSNGSSSWQIKARFRVRNISKTGGWVGWAVQNRYGPMEGQLEDGDKIYAGRLKWGESLGLSEKGYPSLKTWYRIRPFGKPDRLFLGVATSKSGWPQFNSFGQALLGNPL